MKKKVILRFGIYKENPKKKKDDGRKYDLEILKKSKSIYDIAFLSLRGAFDWKHWMAVHRGKQMKKVQLVQGALTAASTENTIPLLSMAR